jgi:hypothetical protein
MGQGPAENKDADKRADTQDKMTSGKEVEGAEGAVRHAGVSAGARGIGGKG